MDSGWTFTSKVTDEGLVNVPLASDPVDHMEVTRAHRCACGRTRAPGVKRCAAAGAWNSSPQELCVWRPNWMQNPQ